MDRDGQAFKAMMQVHEGLPRQGPGSEAMTMQAVAMLPPLPAPARIYDLGCGPGLASMVLANQLQQKVISIDLSEAFVMEVGINAAARNLSHLIEPRCGDMTVLDAAPRSVDLIWAEGSIYCVGFDKALKTWRPYLADGGVVACSELSWLTATGG